MDNLSIINTPKIHTNYVFTAPKRQQKLTPAQTIATLKKLQTCLDVNSLLSNFAAIAAQHVRFTGLSFTDATNNIQLETDCTAVFQQNYHLTTMGKDLGSLLYSSVKPLKINELSILKELHQLLETNLMHALMLQEMQIRIMKDHLTGLDNRASFDENILRSYSLCQRHKSNMALLITDLNDFKRINDTYGHQFGDRILKHYARLLQRSIRNSDVAFRLGGDEFAIILQPASSQSTNLVIERIYSAIQNDELLSEFNITSAIGSAMWRAGETIDSLFKLADEDLYNSKLNIK
ncbi:GGDEF domain-containing protein [Moritella sp. Urea-trap-13]|uniref:GGDEF domain-containing protein n=1 Tax=Moritella sp. Urea-trap-13 TaxID=2058327 RepID=UPI000C3468F7|nr:GGDEF domain-containing protein [Moritella sp. Urea-trap-13]PKH07372.1 GGDEF domain-containing protein [Moritella sp. Urea-trap-13]